MTTHVHTETTTRPANDCCHPCSHRAWGAEFADGCAHPKKQRTTRPCWLKGPSTDCPLPAAAQGSAREELLKLAAWLTDYRKKMFLQPESAEMFARITAALEREGRKG